MLPNQDEICCLLSALGAVTNTTVSVEHMITLCTMGYYWTVGPRYSAFDMLQICHAHWEVVDVDYAHKEEANK